MERIEPEIYAISEEALSYWFKMPGWKTQEAAALLLGVDPDHEELNSHDEYRLLYRLLKRYVAMNKVHSPSQPRDWIHLAIAIQVDIKPIVKNYASKSKPLIDWRKKALRYKREIEELRSTHNDDNLENPRARNTVMLILFFLTNDKMRFPPNSASNVAKSIREIYEKRRHDYMDINFPQVQTIAKWLDEARKLVRGN